ncbi:MAG: nicotinate-nucleotide adenylyltransferase [candidate division Zixibacteria bacterium]|nr:nicotinate-nucleotide adenylyltransferase [candidate division Zixibacteria bacterium]
MSSAKIGIGGGVFDPIHVGHLFLFSECANRLGLDKILLIPTFKAVHKASDEMTEYKHRREMVRLACERNTLFLLSEIEKEQGGPSYTIQTIRALKAEKPAAEWFFIVGLDNLGKMADWYHPDEILKEVTVVVGSRPVDTVSSDPKFKDQVIFLDIPQLDISSTEIRARVRKGQSIKYLVPREIEEYVSEKKLYLK